LFTQAIGPRTSPLTPSQKKNGAKLPKSGHNEPNMTTQQNPYATPPGVRTSTSLEEYTDPMEEASPKTPDSSQENGTNSVHSGQEQS